MKYTKNGLTFERCDNFAIQYHDKNKRKSSAERYANGGFFASYKGAQGDYFTLPIANLVCDIDLSTVVYSAHKYLSPYVSGRKLRYSTIVNQTAQYKGKKVSTLIVPSTGKPYVDDVTAPPANCKYAISGVPTVRNGDDVDYYNYVKTQGWDDSCMYATYRSWLGVKDGEIWIITGKTNTKNYIYGMEFWNKVRSEGFDDIVCLDGGGSYYYKSSTTKSTLGSRIVNNIITW